MGRLSTNRSKTNPDVWSATRLLPGRRPKSEEQASRGRDGYFMKKTGTKAMKKNTRTAVHNHGSTGGTFGFGREIDSFWLVSRARRMLPIQRAWKRIAERSNLNPIISMPIVS